MLGLWLAVMLYGSYVWNLAMPFYRPLGIVMTIVAIGVAILGWSALETGNSRRGLVTLLVIAVGLKLVHWGYYVPEWNYRYSQGPWGRAIGQWVPKRWTLYTFHDWPPDLAFFMKRPVRQLHSPHYLEYQAGPRSKFVLLQASEFENWPKSAPPITLSRSFWINRAEERILARTAGSVPPPLGPNPSARRSIARGQQSSYPPAHASAPLTTLPALLFTCESSSTKRHVSSKMSLHRIVVGSQEPDRKHVVARHVTLLDSCR